MQWCSIPRAHTGNWKFFIYFAYIPPPATHPFTSLFCFFFSMYNTVWQHSEVKKMYFFFCFCKGTNTWAGVHTRTVMRFVKLNVVNSLLPCEGWNGIRCVCVMNSRTSHKPKWWLRNGVGWLGTHMCCAPQLMVFSTSFFFLYLLLCELTERYQKLVLDYLIYIWYLVLYLYTKMCVCIYM